MERIRAELKKLIEDGLELAKTASKDKQLVFITKYQAWYTRALVVIHNLLPDREVEFRRYYTRDTKRKMMNVVTYTLEDYLEGLGPAADTWGNIPFDVQAVASNKFLNQVLILESAESRLDDILVNIRGILQADLFDSELEAAQNLLKNGHIRAAGAVAGVVLESHLSEVCINHLVKVSKREPPHFGLQ